MEVMKSQEIRKSSAKPAKTKAESARRKAFAGLMRGTYQAGVSKFKTREKHANIMKNQAQGPTIQTFQGPLNIHLKPFLYIIQVCQLPHPHPISCTLDIILWKVVKVSVTYPPKD